MNINTVAISGNLGQDPELRATSSGTPVLTFSLAVNERRKNPQTGEYEDRPNWVPVVIFGNRATALGGLLKKGSKIAVTGKLHLNVWETQDGQRRSRLDVHAYEVELMGQPSTRHQTSAASTATEDEGETYTPCVVDENIPF